MRPSAARILRIAAQYSEPEKTALFSKTAADLHKLKSG